jgi:hypothetical protein
MSGVYIALARYIYNNFGKKSEGEEEMVFCIFRGVF